VDCIPLEGSTLFALNTEAVRDQRGTGHGTMKAHRAEEWAEAKKRCRLSDEALRMAKELGFGPRTLIKSMPARSQQWKLPVEAWVRELHRKRFGEPRPRASAARADESRVTPRQERAGPTRNLLQEAEDALWQEFESDAIDAEKFALELDALRRSISVSAGEIEVENRRALERQRSFRDAAHAVAAALAKIPAVHKVMLFGSVAAPLQVEVPRFRRLRRARVGIFHECKDVDLALWISDFTDLRSLKRAAARALTEWHGAHPNSPGVAHHQVDMFLLEASTNQFRGNLCHYGECPKGKPECAVPGCGAPRFVQIREGLRFKHDALAAGTVLFDRATGLLRQASADDDLPF